MNIDDKKTVTFGISSPKSMQSNLIIIKPLAKKIQCSKKVTHIRNLMEDKDKEIKDYKDIKDFKDIHEIDQMSKFQFTFGADFHKSEITNKNENKGLKSNLSENYPDSGSKENNSLQLNGMGIFELANNDNYKRKRCFSSNPSHIKIRQVRTQKKVTRLLERLRSNSQKISQRPVTNQIGVHKKIIYKDDGQYKENKHIRCFGVGSKNYFSTRAILLKNRNGDSKYYGKLDIERKNCHLNQNQNLIFNKNSDHLNNYSIRSNYCYNQNHNLNVENLKEEINEPFRYLDPKELIYKNFDIAKIQNRFKMMLNFENFNIENQS